MKKLTKNTKYLIRIIAQTIAVIVLYVTDIIASGTLAGIDLLKTIWQAATMGIMVIAVEIAKDVRKDGNINPEALSKTLSKTDLTKDKRQ